MHRRRRRPVGGIRDGDDNDGDDGDDDDVRGEAPATSRGRYHALRQPGARSGGYHVRGRTAGIGRQKRDGHPDVDARRRPETERMRILRQGGRIRRGRQPRQHNFRPRLPSAGDVERLQRRQIPHADNVAGRQVLGVAAARREPPRQAARGTARGRLAGHVRENGVRGFRQAARRRRRRSSSVLRRQRRVASVQVATPGDRRLANDQHRRHKADADDQGRAQNRVPQRRRAGRRFRTTQTVGLRERDARERHARERHARDMRPDRAG